MATPPTGHDERRPKADPLLRAAVVVKHVALSLALAASAILFIDYRNAGDPAFCGVASGCFAVRVSPYSHLGPVPLPDLALPAFAILLVGSLLARTVAHHRLVAAAAGVGGLAAIALIAIQAFAVGAFCPWCVIVDASAILAAAAAGLIALLIESDEHAARAAVPLPGVVAWGVAGALAVAMPFLWAKYPAVPPTPPELLAEQQPDKVTIVAFTDFECPFCRKLHPVLDELVEEHPGRVRVVRKMKPLAGHPGALPAAKAFVCAPEQAREALADHLYAAETHELTDKRLVALADKLGLGDRAAFAACLDTPATKAAIDRDVALFEKLGGRGLPFTWVGGRAILGANTPRLVEIVEDELAGPRPSLPVAALFAVLGVALVLASAVTWRAGSFVRGPAVST
jgi:predicted DsbA family dithiol-disulfide isomerase/uncharacterized membrane protein